MSSSITVSMSQWCGFVVQVVQISSNRAQTIHLESYFTALKLGVVPLARCLGKFWSTDPCRFIGIRGTAPRSKVLETCPPRHAGHRCREPKDVKCGTVALARSVACLILRRISYGEARLLGHQGAHAAEQIYIYGARYPSQKDVLLPQFPRLVKNRQKCNVWGWVSESEGEGRI
jgi:hypothetical protein